MRIYLVFLFLFFSIIAFGQPTPKYVPFAIDNPQDTAKTNGNVLIPGVIRAPFYATPDSSYFFSVTANGMLVLRHLPAAGGGVTLVQMNDSLAKKVSYSDSIIKYVTPTQLRDSFRTIYDTFNNAIANNFIPSVLVVTANATPIQLDKGSPQWIAVKGSVGQIIHLPDVTTFQKKGYTYYFDNVSTGNVTVEPFGSSFGIITVPPNAFGWAVCIDTTINVGASWNIVYVPKFLGGPSANTGVIRDNIGNFTVITQSPSDSSLFPASTEFVRKAVKNVSIDTTGLVQKADSNQSNSGGYVSYYKWLTQLSSVYNLASILANGNTAFGPIKLGKGPTFPNVFIGLSTDSTGQFYAQGNAGSGKGSSYIGTAAGAWELLQNAAGGADYNLDLTIAGRSYREEHDSNSHIIWEHSNGAGGDIRSQTDSGPLAGSSISLVWDIEDTAAKTIQLHLDKKGVNAGVGYLLSSWDTVGSGVSQGDQLITLPYANAHFGIGSGSVTSVTAGSGLSGGVITTTGTISMPGVGTAGTYGSATQIPVITTDPQGRVTGATNTPIAGLAWSVITSGLPTTLVGYGITDAYTKTASDARFAPISVAGSVTSVTSSDLTTCTVATTTTTPVITIVSAPKLQTARTIGGVSFDGTANTTVSTATAGFTVSGGDLACGANNITVTGSIGATGARVLKVWATDMTVTNAINGGVTGNAGTVTTNANLTGPITSTGNAVTALTAHDMLIGNGSSAITYLAPGASGIVPYSNGTDFVNSVPTLPLSASATTKKYIKSDGTNWVASTETIDAPGTNTNLMQSDGTNWKSVTIPTWNQNTTGTANIAGGTVGAIPYQSAANTTTVLAATSTANKVLMSGASAAPFWSTPTYPNASATSRKIIVSDGTNFVASTETWAVPGSSGNGLKSDGTNWTAASDFAYLDANQAWTKAQAVTPVALTDAATIAVDLSGSNNFYVALGGNRTLGVPTNVKSGQVFTIDFIQDITGSRTIALPWPYTYSAATAPTLSAGKLADDMLVCKVLYNSTSSSITATNATPGVFTWTAHGLITGQMIQFTAGTTTTPALNTTYWVTVTGANTFNISTTFANCQAATLVTTSGTSGSLTATAEGISTSLNTDFRR